MSAREKPSGRRGNGTPHSFLAAVDATAARRRILLPLRPSPLRFLAMRGLCRHGSERLEGGLELVHVVRYRGRVAKVAQAVIAPVQLP